MRVKRRKSGLLVPDKFFHAHAHTRFSSRDALTNVGDMAAKAKKMGQPALALTDHGNMSGTIQGYKASKIHGLQFFPGIEGYLVEDVKDVKAERYHIGLLSLSHEGYKLIAELSSLSHRRENFHRFPRFDYSHLAAMSEDKRVKDVAVMTGCYFGLIQQALVNQGFDEALRLTEMYAKWFPNLYVEIQNHHIDHSATAEPSDWTDEAICEAMVEIADTLGLPVIATQDSHYLDSKDKPAHELMKRMVYHGDNDNQKTFPGDSFHYATTEWVKEHHFPEHWELAQEAYKDLLEKSHLEFPAIDNYRVRIPKTVQNPRRELRKQVYEGLEALAEYGKLKGSLKRYTERLEHELDVINALKMAGYFMTWVEFIAWLDKMKIAREARGSANGSLVCYVLGITSIDPIQFGTMFERFLSKDRVKPPDIDLDIEDRRRGEAIEWLQRRFGVFQIGTYQDLGAREEDDRGSVLVTYNAYLRRKYDSEYGKGEGIRKFNYRFGREGVTAIRDVEQISALDYKGLRQLSKHNVTKSYGVHAAGVLMNGADLSIAEYVPTMLVPSSKTTVSQFVGDDVEELGYLKKDILGQRTLTAMARTQELILDGPYDHEAMGMSQNPHDFSWIPLNDRDACALLREGREKNQIFQFEGYTMARGARQLGIKSTNDAILAQALYRPACIESGMTDLYIQRRRNPELRQNIWYPHPAFEEVLKSTYGIVLFQEQVLEIMRRLGLSIADINTFFKIVKDSGKGATARNQERAAEVHKRWQDICDANNIEDPEEAWHFIEGYTKYGFNKAHSAGYGVRAYRSAFLKVHFPLEFMTANLETVAGKPAEQNHIREARHMKIRLLSPDVNISGELWTIDRNKNAVRKGLLSIKGIGGMSAKLIAENAPYESVEDLVQRNSGHTIKGGKKYLETGEYTSSLLELKNVGALASLGVRRDYD
ncbi:DNA polymerase III subunit alpha [Streptomyces sp. NPDC006477]|uniref:DNA polymerase III subunit alpha n=1 Tax=Streptomyces sp. NPDC006477 TaxID=3364747 RepID=UPI00367774E4